MGFSILVRRYLYIESGPRHQVASKPRFLSLSHHDAHIHAHLHIPSSCILIGRMGCWISLVSRDPPDKHWSTPSNFHIWGRLQGNPHPPTQNPTSLSYKYTLTHRHSNTWSIHPKTLLFPWLQYSCCPLCVPYYQYLGWKNLWIFPFPWDYLNIHKNDCPYNALDPVWCTFYFFFF